MNKVTVWYFSLLMVLGILAGTKLVSAWGDWYSSHLPCRWQDEAFLNGQVSMAATPAGMGWDMAWGVGGVQQSWGMAVPVWRLPFEAVARALNYPAFPDRLAFGLFLMLGIYAVARLAQPVSAERKLDWWRLCLALVSVMLFPPFLALCCSRFLLYEEVVAYGYIASLLLFVWASKLCEKPSNRGFYALALVAGFTLFIRPTFGVYGMASLALVSIVLYQTRRDLVKICFGGVLFSIGPVLLGWSNAVRFGSPLEFGHSLMFNGIDAMRFASRFDHPYHHESMVSALKELFGLLFLTKNTGAGDGYQPNVFFWQSPTFRWRELYINTFDLVIFGMLLVAAIWFCTRVLNRKFQWQIKTNLNAQLCLWAGLAVMPLIAFYLRFPFISSRYLMDFGPAFAVGVWAFFLLLLRECENKFSGRRNLPAKCLLLLAAGVWWWFEVSSISLAGRGRTWLVDELQQRMATDSKMSSQEVCLPANCYTNGFDFRATHIAFNGWGFGESNSCICVPLFVESPQYLALELESVDNNQLTAKDSAVIQAKVGLEYLRVQSAEVTTNSIKLRFFGPQREQYQKGMQAVFIALIRPEDLGRAEPKFYLTKVTWRD